MTRQMTRTGSGFFRLFILLSLVLLVTRCASLPRLEKREISSDELPKIFAANRQLSRQQSKAIIERLEQAVGPSDILRRHALVMQEISDQPLLAGNKATLLVDGPATYAAMLEAIRNAQDHINLETYIFEDDEVGRRFADLLIQKQTEGVQVNLIYDGLGCSRTPADFFNRLIDAGIQTLQFNPINPGDIERGWRLTSRDHRKILIVDGRIAFTGGVNISSVYSKSSSGRHSKDDLTKTWRDTHVQIEGPAVARFEDLFLETWKRQNGPPLAQKNYFPPLRRKGDDLVRVIGSAPGDKNRTTYLMYISAVAFAKNSIHLTNSYFVPDSRMARLLRTAARRGVDVRLVLPSVTDNSLVYYAGRSYYEDLLESGVKIYERRGSILHAKTAVIDRVWSTIGSTNMDLWSFLRNEEVNAIILGSDFAEEMEALFTKDLENSDQITLEEWKKRSFSDRLYERFSRLLRYWL